MSTETLTVIINGTDTNPWQRMNLRQNPFGMINRAEFDRAEQQINSLDGEPIRDADDIRARLAGFADDFVAYVIASWTPGKRVCFNLYFDPYDPAEASVGPVKDYEGTRG